MSPYTPTYLSILILIGIFTAQQFTQIAETNPKANAVFFLALILVMALVNLLLGQRAAWIALGVALLFWVVGLVVGIFTKDTPKLPVPPRCSSSKAPTPPCTPCVPQCMQCGPYDSEIECVDIRCN
jgi:energy-coupling factor transporter transmembrane protein EcfT